MDSLLKEVGKAMEYGVGNFVLFPKVDNALESNLAAEAYNSEGITPRTIRLVKSKCPEIIMMTDVALDPYSDQGHDGIVEDGEILNDTTIHQLSRQAVCQAEAGANIVTPSDMMDERVGVIHDALDWEVTRLNTPPPTTDFSATPSTCTRA